jgi:hypothetical protein
VLSVFVLSQASWSFLRNAFLHTGHTIKLPPPNRSTGIKQISAKRSPGRLQTHMRSIANLSVNRDPSEKSTALRFRRMCWFTHACRCLLWWTVKSTPLGGLLDLKRQALSVLRTVCAVIRTSVALRTLSTIFVAGIKKQSRPAVILMERSFRSETFWSTGSWPILNCASGPVTLC